MTPHPAPAVPSKSELAEEVRAFLVSVRGGAPFLSGADGRLLVAWLDQDVPVHAILAAIDRVARNRARKRRRTRLTLTACKGQVKKLVGAVAAKPAPAPQTRSPQPDRTTVLDDVAREVADTPAPCELIAPRDALVAALLAAKHAADPALQALCAVRQFHDDAWNAASDRHDALRTAARDQLGDLQEAVSARVWVDLVDETAREILRSETPGIDAGAIWDRLQAPTP